MPYTANEVGGDAGEFAAAPEIGNRCRVMLSVLNGYGRGDEVSEILEKRERSNHLAFKKRHKRDGRSGRILGNEIAIASKSRPCKRS